MMAENECHLAVSDRKRTGSVAFSRITLAIALALFLSRSICTLIKSIGGQHIALSLSLSTSAQTER